MFLINLFRITLFTLSIVLPYFYTQSWKEMSLEEKVGQLLMVHFNGEAVNEDARNLVQNLHVGGIIYYNWSNGLNSPRQIRNLSLDLQKLTQINRFGIPLLIAVDQEGGVVNRLTNGFTIFPGNKALGMAGDPTLAELSAFAMGQELRAVGVNMNLSPVVDINTNFFSPIIGIRSFGHAVDKVIVFAKSIMQGYGRAGIITSLKHFPGHGDVSADSHTELPVLNKTKEQLEKMEFLPFEELSNQADIIMTAHIMVPDLDPENCATLSKDILGYLRREMGFEGVIITDSLVMEGLLKNCSSIDEAAIRALNAGCDILLLGGKQMIGSDANLELTVTDIQRIHSSLVKAVRKGVISKERLNEAVQRILDLKERYALPIAMSLNSKEDISIGNVDQHQSIAKKTASLSIRKIKNKPLPPLSRCDLALFAPTLTKESIEQTSLLLLGKEVHPLFFSGLNPTTEEVKASYALAEGADVLIFCSYNAWNNPEQATLIESLLSLSKPLVLISLRDSYDATLFPEADLILITYSPTTPSIQAAADELIEHSMSVSTQDAFKIAEKIWKNECGGTFNGLTWWNKDENFGSFGIGHFIWYPEGQEEKFEETLPELLVYIQNEGIALPSWLNEGKKCPWIDRKEFYDNFQSYRMIELRQFLFDTKAVQALFIAKRLEKTFPQMIKNLPKEEQSKMTKVFFQMMNDPRGLYAIIDYLNFKGSGMSQAETYKGQGWGLLQILQLVQPSSKNVVHDFVEGAKMLLTQRVENAPPERNEKKWLKGWLNRVNTYLDTN